eukprot:jgi/Mesvir1/1853/Mv06951-RA.1
MPSIWSLFPLLAAVVLAGGTLQGAAGFGFALLTTVAFLSILNSSHAVTVGSIIGLGASATVVPKLWPHLPRPLFFRIGVGIFLGEPLGVAVFFYSGTLMLKLVAGTIVLTFSVILFCKACLEKKPAGGAPQKLASGPVGSAPVAGPTDGSQSLAASASNDDMHLVKIEAVSPNNDSPSEAGTGSTSNADKEDCAILAPAPPHNNAKPLVLAQGIPTGGHQAVIDAGHADESRKTTDSTKLVANPELTQPTSVLSRLRTTIAVSGLYQPICGPPGCRDWFPNWGNRAYGTLDLGSEHPAVPSVELEMEPPESLSRDTSTALAAGVEMLSPVPRADAPSLPLVHLPLADPTIVRTFVPFDVVIGFLTGFFGGAVGLSGPPLVLYLTMALADAPKDSFRAVSGILLASTGAITVVLQLAANGMLPRHFWFIAGSLIPVAAVGGILGNWLSHKISPLFFRYLTLGVLVASSVQLLSLSLYKAMHSPHP